jgi:hypothetical protein
VPKEWKGKDVERSDASEAVKGGPTRKWLSDSGRASIRGPQPVGDRMPSNHEWAGRTYHFENAIPQRRWRLERKYPRGVAYDANGFPDFSPYATKEVKIPHMTGELSDFTQANKGAGIEKKPAGFTWHHHQDCKTMLLVPTDLHKNVRHTGGRAVQHAKEST